MYESRLKAKQGHDEKEGEIIGYVTYFTGQRVLSLGSKLPSRLKKRLISLRLLKLTPLLSKRQFLKKKIGEKKKGKKANTKISLQFPGVFFTNSN